MMEIHRLDEIKTEKSMKKAETILSFSDADFITGTIAKVPIKKIPDYRYILLLDRPSPDYIIYLENSIAVICEQGGILNHFAIVCRELAIPYAVIKNCYNTFKDKDIITLDLSSKNTVIKTAKKDEWIQVIRFIPENKNEKQKRRIYLITKNIPNLIDINFFLEVKVQNKGVFIQKNSLENFIQKVKNNLVKVDTCLKRHKENNYNFGLGVMASIIAPALFDELYKLAGDENKALLLIRGVEPLYLCFDENFICSKKDKYLHRFGIKKGDQIFCPASLKKRAVINQKYHKDTHDIFASIEKDKHEIVKLLSEIIKSLIYFYENKNR